MPLLNNRSSEDYVEFDPPSLYVIKPEEAAKLRERVTAPPFDEPYEALKTDADTALDDQPDPLEAIIYEGHVSNHPDRLHSVKHLLSDEQIRQFIVNGFRPAGFRVVEVLGRADFQVMHEHLLRRI